MDRCPVYVAKGVSVLDFERLLTALDAGMCVALEVPFDHELTLLTGRMPLHLHLSLFSRRCYEPPTRFSSGLFSRLQRIFYARDGPRILRDSRPTHASKPWRQSSWRNNARSRRCSNRLIMNSSAHPRSVRTLRLMCMPSPRSGPPCLT